MRIRNLYDPPTLKDREEVVPWVPAGMTVLTRLCGFDDRSLVDILQNVGLPLVFAAEDHPY